MKSFCWAITIICCLFAALLLVITFTSSSGAPQEAAGAAMAAAVAVIPYVFSKAVMHLSSDRKEEQNDEIIHLLRGPGSSKETKARKFDESQAN